MLRAAILAVLCVCSTAVAQVNNAAEAYREAFQALGIGSYGKAGALISREDNEFIIGLGLSLSQGDRLRLEEILARAEPGVTVLVEGTRARKSDWGLDRSQGFGMLMPHLSDMRQAARLLRARTLLATMDGNKGTAVESLGAIARLGGHSGQDTVAISSLVGSAVGSVFTSMTELSIDAGLIDQSNAQQLLDAAAPIRGNDPFRYADAMRGEFEGIAAEMRLKRPLDDLRGMGLEPSDEMRDFLASPERVQASLRTARGLYERAAAAMTNPDPVAARREIQEVTAAFQSGKAGPFLQQMAPSFERMYEAKLRSDQQLTLLFGRLQAIADGKESPEDLRNAALLLHRAAMAASATPADTQDSIELLRVSPSALDEPGVERTAAMLERMRPGVQALLAEAATMRRCDFAVLQMPAPSLDVPLLGGLRAATRLTLAEGLHLARSTGTPGAAAPAIATAYRVAALLATDATLPRALAAQSIWAEATTALAEATRNGMADADLAKVEAAMASMPTQDVFGWRKGFEADVTALVKDSTRGQSVALTPEIVEMREKVLRQRGATGTLARVGYRTLRRGADDRIPKADDPVLERMTDLWPAAGLQAVRDAHDAAKVVEAEMGNAEYEVSVFDVRVDLPLEEQRTLLRKHDPVRGVVLVDVATAQAVGAEVYARPFELLRTVKRDAPAAPAAPGASGTAPTAPATAPIE